MGLICAWADKTWEVNPNKINPVDNLTLDMAYKEDEGTREKMAITLSYTVYIGTGVDVRWEIESWYWRVGGVDTLYIGLCPFGPPMRLVDVKANNIKVVTDGGWIESATIELSFKEP